MNQTALATKKALQAKSKREVFDAWTRECLPRIHCATIGEQRKAWMIYDLIKVRFGEAVAFDIC